MRDFIDDYCGWFIVIAFIGVLAALPFGARQLSHHYDAAGCHRFGTESSREVRFVDYTFWSWDCLTPTSDGKWIPTDQLRDFG